MSDSSSRTVHTSIASRWLVRCATPARERRIRERHVDSVATIGRRAQLLLEAGERPREPQGSGRSTRTEGNSGTKNRGWRIGGEQRVIERQRVSTVRRVQTVSAQIG